MKAFILTSILIAGLTAHSFSKPINDIYSIKEPDLTEECYVNDIPFNTWKIAVDAILEGDDLKLASEPNVNDIPFSTEKVYCELLAAQITKKYKDEQNTNDLPVDLGFYPVKAGLLQINEETDELNQQVRVCPGLSL